MIVKISKITEDAVIPTRGSSMAAGYDLYSLDNGGIMPSQVLMVGTGLAMEIPEGYFGAIFARSGLASKQGLRPANCVGVVDCDYRGEVKVPVYNDSDSPKVISKGDRVAQIIFLPYRDVEFIEDTLTDSTRGEGGFGSTGAN